MRERERERIVRDSVGQSARSSQGGPSENARCCPELQRSEAAESGQEVLEQVNSVPTDRRF